MKIKWEIVTGIALIHLMAIFALWTFTWHAFFAFLAVQFMTGLGITIGYHRLLAHRSFQVPKWLEYLLTLCGLLALQGGPIKWVSTHRVHHAFSDRAQDPHSPTRGFWWAHMLWLFPYDETLDNPLKSEKFAPELSKDPIHRIFESTQVLWTILLGFILFLLGGVSCVVWGVFLRLVVVYHVTWLVNSASHIWGYQSYDTNEGSRNNWVVGLLSYGEGWHNNHHAYLHSAAHGLRWWEVDISYFTIKVLGWLGLATNIRLPQGKPAKLPSISYQLKTL
jgi:stearoyl-CoA desaturase (delta-9 desaturase)